MVTFYKDRQLWSLTLFIGVLLMSISSKWFAFFDLGVFNYSVLLISSLLIPNLKIISREIGNSQIESVKLPFCELKFSKRFDFYFLGEREGDENSGDMVVIAYYKNVAGEKEALDLLKEEYKELKGINVMETVKQVHYK
jgi:hypothetical protein